jgi:tyrosine-protein phosphatase YwqE
MQIAGYKPILAHPERYHSFQNNIKEYHKLKNAGCLFQLNLLSLTNYYGKKVHETAIMLLNENLIDFVGTDTHNLLHLSHLEKINQPKIIKLIAPIIENNTTLK